MKTIKNVLLAFVAVTAASAAFAAPSTPSCCPNGACCASGVCCAPAGKTVKKSTVKVKTTAPAPAKIVVAKVVRK